MKLLKITIIAFYAVIIISCSVKEKKQEIQISTEYGDIIVELYNETPNHKDNFIKLIQDSFYTNLLFHRTIQGFVIQGGDPESKNAVPGQLLGEGGLKYTIPAEIHPDIYHKRGVIAAARESDDVNPLKHSASTQFYIVQGKIVTESELLQIEEKKNLDIMRKKMEDILENKNNNSAISIDSALTLAKNYQAKHLFKFSESQKEMYTKIGGAPKLDGNYTVFGEVIQGMEVVDKIAKLQTDSSDRPLKDIRFTIKTR